jgi:hypothetical protein
MRTLLALACVLSATCANDAEIAPYPSPTTYSHLLTASGRHYRVIRSGQVLRGANSSVGLMISYLCESLAPAELVRDSDQLVAALGPEMQLTEDTKLTVRAEWHGVAPKGRKPKAFKLDTRFDLKDGRWLRAAAPDDAPALGAGSRQLQAPVDRDFRYDVAKLDAAADAAANWLDHLDAHEIEQIVSGMNPAFREQVAASHERFIGLLDQRTALGMPGGRRALYRMQTRDRHVALDASEAVLIQYECQPAEGTRILERMVLASDATGWRVSGYAFQPIPTR